MNSRSKKILFQSLRNVRKNTYHESTQFATAAVQHSITRDKKKREKRWGGVINSQ